MASRWSDCDVAVREKGGRLQVMSRDGRSLNQKRRVFRVSWGSFSVPKCPEEGLYVCERNWVERNNTLRPRLSGSGTNGR